jgi:urease accessory protein
VIRNASNALGFILATGLLHLAGLGVGSLLRWPSGRIAVRASGGAIALAGTVLLYGPT